MFSLETIGFYTDEEHRTFRYPHYHTPADTPDKVDYESLARVVSGLELVVRGWSGRGAER